MGTEALTLMELRHEEKIFGNKLSIRQVMYLAGGLAGIGAIMGGTYGLNRVLSIAPPLMHDILWGVGGLLSLIPLIGSLMMAFVPALGVWKIPGPTLASDDDGVTPPIRLDQWWAIRRAHRSRTPILPYRRTRALAGEGFTFLGEVAAPTSSALIWEDGEEK